jgi:hypothetical protein
MTVTGDPAAEVAISSDVAAGRRRRKTLAPGELQRRLTAGPAIGSPNSFEVLVEDTSTDSSSDESCDSNVPYNAAMEVVGTPMAPGWSMVVWRGRRTDEELASNFW